MEELKTILETLSTLGESAYYYALWHLALGTLVSSMGYGLWFLGIILLYRVVKAVIILETFGGRVAEVLGVTVKGCWDRSDERACLAAIKRLKP